jgi:hypothetical protein
MTRLLAWAVDTLTAWENRRQARELALWLDDHLSTTPTEIMLPALQQVTEWRKADDRTL